MSFENITSQAHADTYYDKLTSPSTNVQSFPTPPLNYHEAVHAFDDKLDTKYYNNIGGGVIVSLPSSSGFNVLQLTSGDDWPTRDPSSFSLEGSNDGGATWSMIQTGDIPEWTQRKQPQWIPILDTTPYTKYKLTFLTNRGANRFQVSEIEFLKRNSKPLSLELTTSEIAKKSGGISVSELNTIRRFKDTEFSAETPDTSIKKLQAWFQDHAETQRSTVHNKEANAACSLGDFENTGVAYAGLQVKNESNDSSGYGNSGNAALRARYFGGGDYGWTITVNLGYTADVTSPYNDGSNYWYVTQVTAHQHDQALDFTGMGGTAKNTFTKHYTLSFFDRDPAWSTPGQAAVWTRQDNIPYNHADKHLNEGHGHVTGIQTGIANLTDRRKKAYWFKNDDPNANRHYGYSGGLHDSGFTTDQVIAFSWKENTNKVTGWSNMIRCDFPAPGEKGAGLYKHSGDTGMFGDLPDGTSPDVINNTPPPVVTDAEKMQITVVAGATCMYAVGGRLCAASRNIDFVMIPFNMSISSDLLGYDDREVAGVLGISCRMYQKAFWEITKEGIELLTSVPSWAPTSDLGPNGTHWAKAATSGTQFQTGDNYSNMFIRLIDKGAPDTCFITPTTELDMAQSIVKHPHPLSDGGSCTAFRMQGQTWAGEDPAGDMSTATAQSIGNALGLGPISSANRKQIWNTIPYNHSSKKILWTDLYNGDFVVNGFESIGYKVEGCASVPAYAGTKQYAYPGAIINNATSIGGKYNWTDYPFDLVGTI